MVSTGRRHFNFNSKALFYYWYNACRRAEKIIHVIKNARENITFVKQYSIQRHAIPGSVPTGGVCRTREACVQVFNLNKNIRASDNDKL